jgi:hypothetical protein
MQQKLSFISEYSLASSGVNNYLCLHPAARICGHEKCEEKKIKDVGAAITYALARHAIKGYFLLHCARNLSDF